MLLAYIYQTLIPSNQLNIIDVLHFLSALSDEHISYFMCDTIAFFAVAIHDVTLIPSLLLTFMMSHYFCKRFSANMILEKIWLTVKSE